MSLPLPGFWWSAGLIVAGLVLVKWLFRRRYRVGLHPTLASKSGVIYYRTRDGNADYGFSIERVAGDGYRAYIVSGAAFGRYTPHQLSAGGRFYVCWSTPLRSVKAVRVVAARWADATQEYLRTGLGF